MVAIALPKLAVSALQVAGPIFAVGMQAAALDTARSIFVKKSTGELSALPFISLFTNCLIWSFYGFLVKDMSVLYPNALGVFAGLFSAFIFQMFTPKGSTPLKEYGASLSAILVASHFFIQKRADFVGYIGCALAVILMGSPLATLKTVIANKSTDSLPLSTSVVTFFNALSWTLYGLLVAGDKMIYGPNGVGLGLAMIQMSLYAMYGFPKSASKLAAPQF